MKKTLVALAALAATASFAQSSVTMYGNIDQSAYRMTQGGMSVLTGGSNNNTSSYWGLKGTEAIGGGTNINFDLRSELTLATGQVGSTTTSVPQGTITQANNATAYTTALTTATGVNTGAGANILPKNTVVTQYGEKNTMFNRGAYISASNSGWGEVKVGRQADLWWDAQNGLNNSGSASFGFGNGTSIQNTAALSTLTAIKANAAAGQTYSASAANAPYVGQNSALYYAGTAANNPSYMGTAMAYMGGVSYESPVISGVQAKVQAGAGKIDYANALGYNNGGAFALTYADAARGIKLTYATNYKNDKNSDTAWKNVALGGTYTMGQTTFIYGQNKTTFSGLASTAIAVDTQLAVNAAGAVTGSALSGMTVKGYGVNYVINPQWDMNVAYTTLKDDVTDANKFTQTGVTARYTVSKRTNFYFGYGKGKNEGNSLISPIYAGVAPTTQNTTTTGILTGIRHQF